MPREDAVDDEIKTIELHVAGLAEAGRSDAVRQAILGLDAKARISFEPEHDLVRVASLAQALEVTEALARAGLDPTAMTG